MCSCFLVEPMFARCQHFPSIGAKIFESCDFQLSLTLDLPVAILYRSAETEETALLRMFVGIDKVKFTPASEATSDDFMLTVDESDRCLSFRGIQTPLVPSELMMPPTISKVGHSLEDSGSRGTEHPFTNSSFVTCTIPKRKIKTPLPEAGRFSTPQTPPIPIEMKFFVGSVDRALF